MHRINIYCLGTNVIKFQRVVSRTLNERKGSSHLNRTNSTFVVIEQMPLDSSKLVAKTHNQSKGFAHPYYTKAKSQNDKRL